MWAAGNGGTLDRVDYDPYASSRYTCAIGSIGDLDYARDLGDPGQFPFTRGVRDNMYRGRLWTFRQFSGFGGPEETNERYKYLIAQGQTGLSVAFDFPTLYGYDSDSSRALGEVGRAGVAICSLQDMETLMDGIDQGAYQPR